jgi:hypothetical protein
MVKKTSADSGNGHHPQSVERASQRMVDLADKVVQDPDGTERQLNQLADLIEEYLTAGQDQIIERALEKAPDSRVYDEIMDDVLACIEWRTVSGDDAEPLDLILFAVPLHLTLYAPADKVVVPWVLPVVDTLAGSFRRHGLIGNAPDVLLYNYLYSFAELEALSYSKRYQLPQRILKTLVSSRPVDLFQHDERIDLPPGEAHLLLRFMVGLVMQTPEEPQPFISDDEDEENVMQQLNGWVNTVAREVETQLQGPDLEVICVASLPALLQTALQEGYRQHRELALQIVVSQTADESGGAAMLSAFITLPATQPVLTITLIHKDRDLPVLYYPWQLAPWDDPETVIDSISLVLGNAGIQDIQFGEQAPYRVPYLH